MNNKEIDKKILEIVDYIKGTDAYQNYLKSRKLLEENEEIMNLISSIKNYQKEIVKNPLLKKEFENKIEKSLDLLNQEPAYLEYISFQDEINNMLTIFENKVNKYIFDVFN